MQTPRLGLSQKVFAQLERLFRRTGSREFALGIASAARTAGMPTAKCRISPLNMESRASEDLLDTVIRCEVQLLTSDSLTPSIRNLVTWSEAVTVHNGPDSASLHSSSRDLMVTPAAKPSARELSCQVIPKVIKPKTVDLAPLNRPPSTHSPLIRLDHVKSNPSRQFPGHIPVIRRPMDQRFLPKAELRTCWRKAVLKTKRNPQELKLLGFFPGIPLTMIRSIEFSPNPVQIKYWLTDNPKRGSKTASLALFHSLPDELVFLTSSQDE